MRTYGMVYGSGFALKVTPEDRSTDVLHYLLTGHLLGGRTLEGVEWEELEVNEEYRKLQKRRAWELARDMEESLK
jgi:hypothetical protein